jgi:hypothetical protein
MRALSRRDESNNKEKQFNNKKTRAQVSEGEDLLQAPDKWTLIIRFLSRHCLRTFINPSLLASFALLSALFSFAYHLQIRLTLFHKQS